MSQKSIEKIVKQNELIISLLGHLVFPAGKLKDLVAKGSKKPKAIIKAYNLCDGTLSITDIATKVGIAQSSLTDAVNKWEKLGIILKIKEGNNIYPLKLYVIGD